MTEIEMKSALHAAMDARYMRWLAGLQVGDKVKVRDGVASTITKITACQFVLSDKTRVNRNDGSVRGEMGKISEIAAMDRTRTTPYTRSEINCLWGIEAEERAKIMAEIAVKAVAAATEPKKGDVVTTKHHGRGVILDKKGGNYNVLLDKKDSGGRGWQQFFEPHEIVVEQPQPANEPTTLPTLSQTFGEKAVGLSFNPSSDDAVENCKKEYATAIDRMNILRSGCVSAEVKRLANIAIAEAQAAQMWAVEALTWRD